MSRTETETPNSSTPNLGNVVESVNASQGSIEEARQRFNSRLRSENIKTKAEAAAMVRGFICDEMSKRDLARPKCIVINGRVIQTFNSEEEKNQFIEGQRYNVGEAGGKQFETGTLAAFGAIMGANVQIHMRNSEASNVPQEIHFDGSAPTMHFYNHGNYQQVGRAVENRLAGAKSELEIKAEELMLNLQKHGGKRSLQGYTIRPSHTQSDLLKVIRSRDSESYSQLRGRKPEVVEAFEACEQQIRDIGASAFASDSASAGSHWDAAIMQDGSPKLKTVPGEGNCGAYAAIVAGIQLVCPKEEQAQAIEDFDALPLNSRSPTLSSSSSSNSSGKAAWRTKYAEELKDSQRDLAAKDPQAWWNADARQISSRQSSLRDLIERQSQTQGDGGVMEVAQRLAKLPGENNRETREFFKGHLAILSRNEAGLSSDEQQAEMKERIISRMSQTYADTEMVKGMLNPVRLSNTQSSMFGQGDVMETPETEFTSDEPDTFSPG